VSTEGGQDQDSPAFVDPEPASTLLPKHGMSYFFEVFEARDFLHDWLEGEDKPPTWREQCERLIIYAVDDA